MSSAALAAAVLSVPAGSARAAEVTEAFDEYTAAAAALAEGRPVEVLRLRSGTSQSFKNPDGTTTVQQYQEPVRARQDGEWRAVDSTLVAAANGTVEPRVSATALTFSGGGGGPLATVSDHGVRLDVQWPTPLPKPTLDGATAVYAGVLPGVDLRLTAVGSTFTQHLVVSTPEAGRRPELRSLRLGYHAEGGRLAANEGGGFDVLGRDGSPVWTSATATMWDASGGAPVGLAAVDDHDEETGPRDGDRVRRVKLALVPGGATLTADASFLDDPATRYPVTIDPTVASASSSWTMVNKTFPSQSYYLYPDQIEKVGWTNLEGTHTKRLFYGFKTSSVAKVHVMSATIRLFETGSATCTAGTVDAYLTNSVGSGTTWNAQPAKVALMSSTSVKAGRSDCYPGGQTVEFNVTSGVRTRVAASAPTTTFGLYGRSESTISSWMRFAGPKHATVAYRPVLTITYDRAPAAPLQESMKAPQSTVACGRTSADRRSLNPTSSTANFITVGKDPDGGTISMTLSIYDAAGALKTTLPAGTKTGTTSAGATFVVKIPTTWPDGNYSWRAKVSDGTLTSVSSGPCYIRLDRVHPLPPTITTPTFTDDVLSPPEVTVGVFTFAAKDSTSFVYTWAGGAPPARLAVNGTTDGLPSWNGNMSVQGSAALAVLQVTAYDAAGNASTVSDPFYVKRPVGGRLADYRFNEATLDDQTPAEGADTTDPESQLPSDSISHYALDLNTQLAGRDRGRWWQATDDPCWDDTAGWTCAGAHNGSLQFAGAEDGDASVAQRPVLSERSFTVGAWVRLDDDAVSRTLLAQDLEVAPANPAQASASYDIGYDAGARRFVFHVLATGGAKVTAYDALPATVMRPDGSTADLVREGAWVYLAGSYDKAAGTIRLDAAHQDDRDPPGSEIGPMVVRTGPVASLAGAMVAPGLGTFHVGDGWVNTAPWSGLVDNVAVWQQSLPTSDVLANLNDKR